MKRFSICALGALLLTMTGCMSERNHLVLDSVGPANADDPPGSTDGFLTVYSAYDAGAHFYDRTYDGKEYSDYSIFDKNGKLLRKVHNSTDTAIEAPATVTLPPGQYKVIARANGYGDVTVPITIGKSQQTVLHLEGGETASELAGADPNNEVRLPDGQVVGLKSNP